MAFVGVYRALYDYTPQANNELAIDEGDLLFILEKSTEDDWWKAKRKATAPEEEEPEGLIPNNYVEEATPLSQAKALYDYSRQTDEELSFSEDDKLQIYDTSDPDWTLVGLNGEYGFVPANYIETAAVPPAMPPALPKRPPVAQDTTEPESYPSPVASPVQSPAAALAGIIQQKTGPSSGGPSISSTVPPNVQFTPEASDEEQPPPLPQRPVSQHASPPTAQYATPQSPEPSGVMASPTPGSPDAGGRTSPGGYRLYHIHEMISHQGKNRKMPTTLGINIAKGVIMIAPEKSRDGPQKEWTADKLTHYSIEGKHVFVELVRPSKSIDFHAGTKDTAQDIVSGLGELAGAARAEGLREVFAASTGGGPKKGHMLYEFMADDDDTVTVAVGDEVLILDDTQSEEWWLVRRVKNGKQGLVPSSFVEVTSTAAPVEATSRPTREQKRQEEERLARESVKSSGSRNQDTAGGVALPDRHSSLGGSDTRRTSQRGKRGSRSEGKSSNSKPDPSRVRTWTDRTGKFKVDAQFIGLKDNNIHLHKVNGVKIAVLVAKMSLEDLEYVERQTGRSLDEEKPLSEIKRKNTQKQPETQSSAPTSAAPPTSGAAVQPSTKTEFDWFDFFLQCGVNPQICERYASAFSRDQMGEESLQDIDPTLLRTLGLKEGDILRVMKFLNAKFGRQSASIANVEADGMNGDSGGLFSGPGGALRNNTRKGRPAPAVQNNDTVDPRAFEQSTIKEQPPDATPTPLRSVPAPAPERVKGAFDDNAWDVKPQKLETAQTSEALPAASTLSQSSAPSGALQELSLLSPPLEPTLAPKPAPPQAPAHSQPKGADPSFFDKLTQPSADQLQAQSAPRQRPQAPQQSLSPNSLLPPPPQRPGSAPQNYNQNAFSAPPLRPQVTGNQSQITPQGQTLNDLNQQRMQQASAPQQIYPQQTGYLNGIVPQQTGYPQIPQQFQQPPYGSFQQTQLTGLQPQQHPFMNGQPTGSPFADPGHPPYQPQPMGFQSMPGPPTQAQTGINSMLPPALQPTRTGINGFNQNPIGFGQQQAPPVPPMPPMPQQPQPQQQPAAAPLQPQPTGPAPPVRFGVAGSEKKLMPQPTGRRANLSQATPQNPFGF